MIKRRTFIQNTGIAAFGLAISSLANGTALFSNKLAYTQFISNRPLLKDRRFTSKAVEAKIESVKKLIKDEELSWMFENCYPNTLDTTVSYSIKNGKPYTYVITGDIDAMWLRDSSAQVFPYLTLMKEDDALRNLIAGVVNQHAAFIQLDPYANAFYNDPNKVSEWKNDKTLMKPGVHERKWEIDSLCYTIRLAYHYWKHTDDKSCFDSDWLSAMKLVVKTFKEQQRKEGLGPYSWERKGQATVEKGFGRSVKSVGLIFSMFRPSDDATLFPFLISSNLFAVVSLRQLAEICSNKGLDTSFANECTLLAEEVNTAIEKYGIVNNQEHQKVFAYEVDGFGSVYFADDANVPSLLSLPYIGAVKRDDPVYVQTRKYLLSEKTNPYYTKGRAGEGIASPHINRDMIWPMAIILRAMTSTDEKEIVDSLKQLKATHAGTGFMHESFYKDDAKKYTREWFAWANTLFGELIIKIADENPKLLQLQL